MEKLKEIEKDTEIRKELHKLINKLDDKEVHRVYQLVRGMFGRAI